ncbi:MAG: tetratricopeptide repeat protein [Gammaproteobacteria bacterium]|nr:tetratricopeptide repeat protein [Gammaproteobacteria bacterium]
MGPIGLRIRSLGRRLLARQSQDTNTAAPAIGPATRIVDLLVVPLADRTADASAAAVVDSFTDDLHVALARLPGLSVARALVDVGEARCEARPDRPVAGRGGVSGEILGFVAGAGSGLWFDLRRAAGGARWAGHFADCDPDYAVILGAAVIEVADALGVAPSLAPSVTDLHGRRGGPAYLAVLQGRHYASLPGRRRLEQARRLFRDAATLDSDYARAWAELAGCSARIYAYSVAEEGLRNEAAEAVARALALAPEHPGSHVAAGLVAMLFDRWGDAQAHFGRALALQPDHYNALYQFGRACMHQGEPRRAAELYRVAAGVMPHEYQATLLAAQAYAQLDDEVQARAWTREGVARVSRHHQAFPDDGRALSMGAAAFLRLGECAAARDWINRALALDPEDIAVHYNAACLYARLGDVDTALACLERLELREMVNRGWVEQDPDLTALRGHPRFEALLTALRD